MNLTLNLSSTDLDPEGLQVLTRQLCGSITSETEIKAEIPSGVTVSRTKGDPITLGVIALTFLTSGSAVALFEIFKAYFSRVPQLETIEIVRADGTTVKVTEKNIKLEQIQALLSQLDNTSH